MDLYDSDKFYSLNETLGNSVYLIFHVIKCLFIVIGNRYYQAVIDRVCVFYTKTSHEM